MHMTHRERICLVSPEILAAERQRSAGTWLRGRVTKPWWAHIVFDMDDKFVTLRVFRSGDESGMQEGVWERRFAWEDLDNPEFKRQLAADEWEPVKSKISQMLEALHESRLAMRRALASSFAQVKAAAA